MKKNVCSYITDSLCCTEEINTTLYINHVCVLSHRIVSESLPTPWIRAHQAPLFMGFSRQEYWSGLPCPPLGNLPDSRSKSPALAGSFFTTSTTWEAQH